MIITIAYKLGRYMAVMTITNQKPDMSICLIICTRIEASCQPHYAVLIACPSFRIIGEFPSTRSIMWNPIGYKVVAFQYNQWSNISSIGTDTFNSRDPLLAIETCLIPFSLHFINDNIRTLSLANCKTYSKLEYMNINVPVSSIL